jgi:hypothetical protein
MVMKYDVNGFPYGEPPYTEAEQMEMYRRMNGVVAFTRPVPKGPKTEERPVPKASRRRTDQDVG